MPYILSSKRDVLDPVIKEILNCLRELESDDPSNNMEGNINYVISKILAYVYPGVSYREVNDAMGMMTCCAHEYYRRIAIPLENQKAHDNGDVY